jgi:uncharacterized protein
MGFFGSTQSYSTPMPSSISMSDVMRRVYMWLCIGLVVSFGVAFALRTTATIVIGNRTVLNPNFVLFNPAVMIGTLIVYIIMAFATQPIIMRVNTTIGSLVYVGFTALFGFMMSVILVQYTDTVILAALGASAGMFGVMSFIGFTTKTDLSKFGSILMMALVGMLIASVINLFLRSELLYWVLTYLGVLVFCGLTAYDTQWIKNNAGAVASTGDETAIQRLALIGAFHLFLDFVNLFLYMLRIFGASRD